MLKAPIVGLHLRAFGVLLSALLPFAPAMADALAAGLEAWQRGDRVAAVAAWQPVAEQGHAEASLFLGYVYRNGLGVTRDTARAAHWYRIAASRGWPEAQYELGLMYELGLGVPVDPAEAAHWYGLATAQACPAELSAGARLGDR